MLRFYHLKYESKYGLRLSKLTHKNLLVNLVFPEQFSAHKFKPFPNANNSPCIITNNAGKQDCSDAEIEQREAEELAHLLLPMLPWTQKHLSFPPSSPCFPDI